VDTGGWVCEACRSINRPGATHCYSCLAPAPVGLIEQRASSPRLSNIGIVATLAIVFAVGGLVLLSGHIGAQPSASGAA
jgi:hypothetical protein